MLTTAGGAATPARPFAVALEGWATDPTPAARAGHTAVWTGTRMVVWGGRVSYSSLDYYPAAGGRYDPATGAWTRTATGGAAPAARAEHTAVWTGTELLVFGGTDGAARSDGAAYDPEADAWRTLATADAPGARSLHTAVWTGTEMIVWGGWQGPGTHTATGGRYDPATDTWRPISTIGAPTARRAHTAVWTGTEMIVWGGIDAVGTCKDGARYDPATDTWRPVQSTGAPSARNAHTAVWTGTEMIVWGGFSLLESSAIGSGALYDPATDAWRPVTSTNSPSSRGGHAAIWTGTEMVLWGGWSGGAGLSVGTGSRFDPAANTWTYLSFSAPVARHDHTAIWTGTELIVWGGEGYDRETPFFADGGRWRVEGAADVWTRIPGDGAAPQRTRHAAAWTGRELVVWGGSSADLAPLWKSFIQRGARYDPATATWASVSTVGQPTQRADMPAVWTGSRVIVW